MGTLQDVIKDIERKYITPLQQAQHVEVGIIDDKEIATYATYVEYGWVQRVTKKQAYWFSKQGLSKAPSAGSALVCPPRPFFRSTLAAKAEDWAEIGAEALKASDGTKDVNKALITVGEVAQADIKETIVRGGIGDEQFERRAPLTMELYENQSANKRKDGTGHISGDKPLMKTGAMLRAIGYQLVK